jgi:hypothetical protein
LAVWRHARPFFDRFVQSGAGPDIPVITSDIGMLQVCLANGQAGSLRRIKSLGLGRIAMQASFVTVVFFGQARAKGIRLDALQIPTVVSGPPVRPTG